MFTIGIAVALIAWSYSSAENLKGVQLFQNRRLWMITIAP
jgi:hypothetical protein